MRKQIFIVAMATTMLLSLGMISSMADGGASNGIKIHGGTTDVDSIDSTENYGAAAEPDASATPDGANEANINVTNDVIIEHPEETYGYVDGIKADAGNNEKAEVNVGTGGSGNVTVNTDHAFATGVNVKAATGDNNSSASASVKGDITVTSDSGDTTGIKSLSSENGNGGDAVTSVTVDGSVTVKSVNAATGIDIESKGGENSVEIGKNLTVSGGDGSNGIKINTNETAELGEQNSTVKVTVKGDVESSDDGIQIETENGDQIDVVIEGKLKTEGNAIDLHTSDDYDHSNLSITAWKIESGNKEALVTLNGGDQATSEQKAIAEKVEKSINYILKIDSKYTDNVSFTGEKVKTINNLDTAHADDKVAIKLDRLDGFRVKNVYTDEAKTILKVGDDGNYYLIVPSGGGVLVSLELEEIPDPVEPDPVNPVVPVEPTTNDNDDSSSDRTYIDNSIRIDTLSDSDMSFNQNEGILTITIPKGMTAFYLDSSVLLTFKAMGMNTLYLDTTSGKYTIPLSSIEDIVKEGNLLTFVIRTEKVDVYLAGLLTREFYPDKMF